MSSLVLGSENMGEQPAASAFSRTSSASIWQTTAISKESDSRISISTIVAPVSSYSARHEHTDAYAWSASCDVTM